MGLLFFPLKIFQNFVNVCEQANIDKQSFQLEDLFHGSADLQRCTGKEKESGEKCVLHLSECLRFLLLKIHLQLDELGVSKCDMKSELQAVCLRFTLCSRNPPLRPRSTFLSALLICTVCVPSLLISHECCSAPTLSATPGATQAERRCVREVMCARDAVCARLQSAN